MRDTDVKKEFSHEIKKGRLVNSRPLSPYLLQESNIVIFSKLVV